MTQTARLNLSSTSLPKLNDACDQVLGIGRTAGVKVRGPIPLPRKRLNIATRKSPCGNGTETYEKWEMRLHRRLIELSPADKVARYLVRLDPPDDVHLEMKMTTD